MRIIMLFTFLLFSCKAVKEVETKNHNYDLKGKEVRSFNKSQKAFNLNAQGSRVFSLYQFPTKDSIATRIEYKEGKTDTLIQIDTLIEYSENEVLKYVYRDRYIHRVDTIVKDSIISVVDTRGITALTTENKTCKDDLIQAKDDKELWRNIALVLFGIIFVAVGVWVFIILKR